MVFPSSSISRSDETVDKGNVSVSVKSKVIRKHFPKKARKLSRRRRKAKRRNEKYIKESKQMASVEKGPYDYYWGNYFRCVKWVQNHNASYWKSRAQALEYENRMLRELIDKSSANQLDVTRGPEHSSTCRNSSHRTNIAPKLGHNGGWKTKVDHQNYNFDANYNRREQTELIEDPSGNEFTNEGEEFEFEVDENMIEFFTQSMKHKMELQREREKNEVAEFRHRKFHRRSGNLENKNIEEEFSYDACMMGLKRVLPTQCSEQNKTQAKDLEDILLLKAQREEKERLKHQLFGKSASKILGMETAVQLNFQQFCASKHPVVWPIIPLNL